MKSVPGAVATGSDWSATVPVAALSRRVIASEDACAPVTIAAPGTDSVTAIETGAIGC